jgi:transcriptional regulator with XRE-family HTH domain
MKMEKESQRNVLTNSEVDKGKSTNLLSREVLWSRLASGPDARARFVESNLGKHLAFQIRALREREEWSQERLAEVVGMNQNAISRLENPFYGKLTLTTLKRIASAFDVGLVVRFEPFGQLIDWVSGTPHVDIGLSPEKLGVMSFSQEFLGMQQSSPGLGSMAEKGIPRTERLDLGSIQDVRPSNSAASQVVPPRQKAA